MRTPPDGQRSRSRRERSGSEEAPDARFDFGARPAEAHAAGFDQPVRVRPPRAGRVVEVEAERRGRRAGVEQPRPGGKVRQVEQRIRVGRGRSARRGSRRRVAPVRQAMIEPTLPNTAARKRSGSWSRY